MHIVVDLIALVAVVCVVSALARRLGFSAPLALVAVGVLGSYLPFVPDVELSPELVLVGFLPPLLYSAAIRTSLIDFRANRRAIGLLSVGYVVFGTLVVGAVAHWVFQIDWAPALALGAVVAPPDAVSATAIARKIGLPRRVVDILEGESLVNDATAIVCLRTALAAVLGVAATPLRIGANFLIAAGGGVAVGLALAFLVVRLRPRITDVVTGTVVSFTVPFVAYVAAESFGGSGVLAVVIAGILIGHKSPMIQDGPSRLSERINWATVKFLLENVVFLLIGLQVRPIFRAVEDDSLGPARVWWGCALILVTVLIARPIWVFPATYLPRLLVPAIRRNEPLLSWTYPAVTSWAGMRGVVTLAAVFALPEDLPHRAVLVLAAFLVVAGTLIIQGLTLPALVRLLKIRGPDPREDLLQNAVVLQETAEAGLAELESARLPDDPPAVIETLQNRMEQRRTAAWERLGSAESDGETPSQRFLKLRMQMLTAERGRVLDLRREGNIAQHILDDVLEVLDVEEALVSSWGDPFDQPEASDRDLVAPQSVSGGCEHLADAPVSRRPLSPGVCEDCVRENLTWVHLRMCLGCGNVGCCDSSPGKHADKHYTGAQHPVMRSIEPGEAWRWCYVDSLVG